MTKSNLEQKEFILLTLFESQFIIKGIQGSNMKIGAYAEAMEECCLLSCSLWLSQPAYSTTGLSAQK